jgi:hypothetical protein
MGRLLLNHREVLTRRCGLDDSRDPTPIPCSILWVAGRSPVTSRILRSGSIGFPESCDAVVRAGEHGEVGCEQRRGLFGVREPRGVSRRDLI